MSDAEYDKIRRVDKLLIAAAEKRDLEICRHVERLWLRDRATNIQAIESWAIRDRIEGKTWET